MDYYKYILQNPRVDFALDKTLLENGENFFSCCSYKKCVLMGSILPLSAFNETNEGVIVARFFGDESGGPFYLDENTIKVSFLLDKVDLDNVKGVNSYRSNCKQWVMKSLKDLGVETTTDSSNNDIFLNGKKICGVTIIDKGDKFFFAFAISLFIDFEIASRVMNITKHTTNLADRANGVNQMLETPITSEQIFDSLKNNVTELWGIELKNPIDTPLSSIPNFQKNLDMQNDENWIKYGRLQKPDFS